MWMVLLDSSIYVFMWRENIEYRVDGDVEECVAIFS